MNAFNINICCKCWSHLIFFHAKFLGNVNALIRMFCEFSRSFWIFSTFSRDGYIFKLLKILSRAFYNLFGIVVSQSFSRIFFCNF